MDLKAIKTAVSAHRNDLEQRIENNELSITDAMQERTDFMDSHITAIADNYLDDFKGHTALVFTGASGRVELCPYSDNDFFLLFSEDLLDNDGTQGLKTEFYDAFVNFSQSLTDSGIMDNGLGLRTVKETLQQMSDPRVKDAEVHSQLLDRRAANWGSIDLYQQLDKEISLVSDEQYKNLIATKFASYDKRFIAKSNTEAASTGKTSGNRIMVIEPNIKEGYGGLRGYQTAKWCEVAYLHEAGTSDNAKEYFQSKKRVLSAKDQEKADDAYQFLLKVRYHLHFIEGKEIDVIESHTQPILASRVGYDSASDLMTDIFRANKDIAYAAKITCSIIAEQLNLEAPGEKFENYMGLQTDDPSVVDILQLFRAAQRRKAGIDYRSLATIKNSLDNLDENILNSPEVSDLMLDIIMYPTAEKTLRHMQKFGVLQKVMPVFGEIDSFTQCDPRHAYTVDDHHFNALGHVHKMRAGKYAEYMPVVYSAVRTLSDQDYKTLCISALLHDVCQTQKGDRKHNAAQLTRNYASAFGLENGSLETAAWLSEKHNFLHKISVYPYAHNTKISQRLVDEVKTLPRQNMLLGLTIVDAMAAGPYDPDKARWRRLDKLKLSALENLHVHVKDSFRGFALPENYQLGETFAEVANVPTTSSSAVHLITRDKPNLFLNTVGVLAEEGCDIRGVSAMPFEGEDGAQYVSNKYTVYSKIGEPLPEKTAQRVIEKLQAVCEQDGIVLCQIQDNTSAQTKEKNAVLEQELAIELSNEYLEGSTALQITAADRVGLLYDIVKSASKQGLSVVFCTAVSEPGQVLDTLIIQQDNSAIPEEEFEPIRQTLMADLA